MPAAKRFFTKALARHGRPYRIVIDGSQTNREGIVSCDATSLLQDCSRRRSKPIPIRQSQYLNTSITASSRIIRSSAYQAPGAADARFQIDAHRRGHPVRDRDGPHDAQTTGAVRLHPKPSLAEQLEILAAV
nr:hypothetical protein [Sinorhizobium terangae]